jgi:iron complex outermembrane recepter protein
MLMPALTIKASLTRAIIGVTVLGAATGGVFAQSASDNALQEIVVTAQKRTESERTVPISITALSGDALNAQHIADFMDLSRTVPGLSLTSQGSPGLNNLELRGVSSQAGGSTVAVYIDETPVSTPHVQAAFSGTTEPDFLDIDRVEVLRGPQGTLYGASSMGGTIRYISRQPTTDGFDATTDADFSGTDHGGFNYRVTSAVNIPLVTDVSAIRVAALYGHSDGWVNQLSQSGQPIARGVNDQEDAAFRFTWLIQPANGFRITPAVYVQRTTTGDTSAWFDSLGPYDEAKLLHEPLDDLLVVPTLRLEIQGSALDFNSVSSFLMRDLQHDQDGTTENSVYLAGVAGSPPPEGFGFGTDVLARLASPIYARTTVRQWSQELRVSSPTSETSGLPISWVGGVYLSDQRLTYNEGDFIPGFNADFLSLYGVTAASFFGAPFPDDGVYTVHNLYDERQYAAFGDLTINLLDSLRFSTGLRYLEARESSDFLTGDYFGTGQQAQVSFEHALTPKFALTYLLDPNTTLYATASKGFRLGGGDSALPQALCGQDLANIGLKSAPLTYSPDSLWNYEVGTKLGLLNNSVSIDADVYYIKWNDIQQDIYLPDCEYYFEDNVGHARSYGSELSIQANATSHLTLSFAGGTTQATIIEDVKALNVKAGAHILGVPEWSAHVGARLHGSLPFTDEGFVLVDYGLTGPSNGTFDPTQVDYHRPEYTVLNLSTGMQTHGWKLTLYAQNALDDKKAIQHINNNGLVEAFSVKPPTVGITVSKDFPKPGAPL